LLEPDVDDLICTLFIGAGATVMMDLWAIARLHILGIPPPEYGLVGRWLAHMVLSRRLRHERISAAPAVGGERLIGWAVHYLTGISFATLLPAIWGSTWIREPTIGPALLVGVGTVAAPFLLMQPGMGAGIAASRTPRPAAARLQSLVTHTIFGLGLYAAARATGLFHYPGA
jgi:hypothetical protein